MANTPQQLKDIALDAAKAEFNDVVATLEKAANNKEFSAEIRPLISTAAVHLLKDAGFNVAESAKYDSHIVSFS